jgi:predicted phage baseplate assembly protein
VAGPTPEAPEVVEVRLAGPLTGCYDRETVRILANVAPSTHGETRTQVLGSGDAATPYQRFRLAQNPLTYVAAKSGGAVVSTLEIRVDGRLWTEVPRLFGTGPSDEVYTTVMDDDGVVTIQFGDGATGARLPTGTNNVAATYRVGTGLAGRVAAEQLTLLMSRPLGLRSVTNPVAAGLAADPEPPEAVRSNAARAALTLDRVVSIRDVEDFARSVPGIGKARADGLWDGRTRLVHLTVAGVGAQTVDEQAITDLAATLRAIGDPRLPLVVQAAEVVPVYVTASVVVDAAYEPATVLAAVAAEVTAALTVEARALGQPLTSGDIVLAAHRVPGAAAVIVSSPPVDVSSFQARIVAGTALPAQLVALAPGGLTLTEAVP